jgi:hypothetical protein
MRIPCRSDQHFIKDLNLYTLMYNVTKTSSGFLEGLARPWPINYKLTRLKQLMDNAYMAYYSEMYKITTMEINIKTMAYPIPPSRFVNNSNVMFSFGPFYLFFPPMIIFSMLLIDIVKEKEKLLKNYLNLLGLSLTGYWLSWLIFAMVNSLIVSSEIVLFGRYIFSYEIFVNANMLVPLSLFFTFTLSIQIFAMFISSLVKSTNVATAVNIYLFSFLMAFS